MQKCTLPAHSPLNTAKYLIIDEISMVSKTKLQAMQRALSTKSDGNIMGNISFIFFGDFLQFTPVGGTSLINPNTKQNELLANSVVASINAMVELTEQKRQNDIPYLQMLRNLRSFKPTENDVSFLKKHCSMPAEKDQTDDWLLNAEYIVSENKKRILWNTRITKAYAKYHERNLYKISAMDSISCENTLIVDRLLENSCPGYFQKNIYMVIGMPMVVFKNKYKKLGVVNGSIGHLTAFHHDEYGNLEAIELNFPNLNFKIPGLEKNSLIFCREKIPHTITQYCTKFDYIREQFPVSEGFCLTDYKKQGATVQTHSVVSLTSGSKNDMSVYVKLSRSKSSEKTFIDGEINLKILQMKKPEGYDHFRATLDTLQENFFRLDRANFFLS